MTEPLPELLDAKRLQGELGVTKAAADRILRSVPTVEFPGLRKVYARRSDLEQLLESSTSEGEWRFVKTGVARSGAAS